MLLYGRGAASVAEQIGKTKEEAQEIIDKFYQSFPKVKKWIDETMDNAHTLGYVEDVAGRRRRLPDIFLPKYTVDGVNTTSFNPLLLTSGINGLDNDNSKKYLDLAYKCKSRKDLDKVKQQAELVGIHIHDNTGFIAQAERQAVNSRVQGGAATLTKAALIRIYHDDVLASYDAHLINTVHDEILVEAPSELADKVADRLTWLMIDSAKQYVTNVPMKCDPYIVDCWYLDEFFVLVENEFKKLLDSGLTDIEAFEQMCATRTESTRDQIYEIVHGSMKNIPNNINKLY